MPSQQSPHWLNGALYRYRNFPAQFGEGPVKGDKPGLEVDCILSGFHQEQVNPAFNQAKGLFLVGVGQ